LIEEGKLQLAHHMFDIVIKGTEEGSENLLNAYKIEVRFKKK